MTYTFVNVEVESAGLKVTTTDATKENFPTNIYPSVPDEDGRQFYYKPVKKQKTKHKLYCTKLGAALARELKRTDSNIDIPNGEFRFIINSQKFQLRFINIFIPSQMY